MKVILLEDVKSLGKKGQLVDVSDGYARNFILAKKLGLEATSKNMNDLKLQKAHEDKLAAERLAEAKAFAEDLKKVEVTFSITGGEGGGNILGGGDLKGVLLIDQHGQPAGRSGGKPGLCHSLLKALIGVALLQLGGIAF